jgi:hypothetical protein
MLGSLNNASFCLAFLFWQLNTPCGFIPTYFMTGFPTLVRWVYPYVQPLYARKGKVSGYRGQKG